LFALSPEGYLAVGRNERYNIELQKPGGAVYLTRDLDPAPVLREEHAEWSAFRESFIQNSQSDIEVVPIPWEKPFYREIRAGKEGRIWVFRYVTATKRDDIEPIARRPDRPVLTWREPTTYDVFEPDGTFLGTLVLPDDFEPHVFRGRHIWGTCVEEDGVEKVVRLRVVPEERQ